MKIGICCYPSYGGSGVVATELGIQLAQRGHEVHFIAHNKPFRLGHFHPNIYYHEVEAPNYPVFIHPPYLLAMANTIKQVHTYYGLDILHAHYAVPHGAAAWMAREMIEGPVGLINTLHGTDVTIMGEEPSIRDAVAFSVRKSDCVTAVSDSLKAQAEETLEMPGSVQRIYNFIDEALCVRKPNDELRRQLGIRPEEKVLIHMSNFRPVKRICDIMKIFKLVAAETDSRLMLIGEGPDLACAHNRLRECGLGDKVLFMGKQTEVMDLLSLGDLFLLPSEKESFGLAALEAMGVQVPVIGSDAGGLPELIEDGVTGFTCQVGAVECMAGRCIELLNDDDRRKAMGLAAQGRAVSRFGTNQIIPQYERLYEAVYQKIRSEHS